jgi:hypothetical protein
MASKRKGPYPIPREPKVIQQLRLPKSLHRELKAAARAERTSMHAEMLRRLSIEPEREWMANMLRLILEAVHGRQAQEGAAAQNGAALSQRQLEADQ